MGDMVERIGLRDSIFALSVLTLLGFTAVTPLSVQSQEAPFIEVLPRREQARQLELRGDLKMVRKRYSEALEFYQQALKLEPKNAVLLNKTGITHHQLFELGKAEKYYKRATRADKNYEQAWNNLGATRYGRKDYKGAVRYYRRALESNPVDAAIRSNLGMALFSRKKYDEALQEYRLALLLDPDVFDRRGRFGVVLQERTVEDRGQFHYLLAKSFMALGFTSKCLLYLRRALEEGVAMTQVEGDPVFLALRDDPVFQELLRNPPVALR